MKLTKGKITALIILALNIITLLILTNTNTYNEIGKSNFLQYIFAFSIILMIIIIFILIVIVARYIINNW